MSVQDLRIAPMMAHLLDALDDHKDIGHHGRLVFAMVARYFTSEDHVAQQLQKNPGVSKEDAIAMVKQVVQKGYSPPQRGTILE